MNQKYLGDSYDIVKRFWAESLRPIAPLYAHSRFIPERIRAEYSLVTKIPILDPQEALPLKPFGIFLDPDTGIPSPSNPRQQTTAKHTPLNFVVEIIKEFNPTYLICFDQSYHRKHELNKQEQNGKKMEYLREFGLTSFYFESQAPFLFVSQNPNVLDAIRRELMSIGVPARRFNPTDNLQ